MCYNLKPDSTPPLPPPLHTHTHTQPSPGDQPVAPQTDSVVDLPLDLYTFLTCSTPQQGGSAVSCHIIK